MNLKFLLEIFYCEIGVAYSFACAEISVIQC